MTLKRHLLTALLLVFFLSFATTAFAAVDLNIVGISPDPNPVVAGQPTTFTVILQNTGTDLSGATSLKYKVEKFDSGFSTVVGETTIPNILIGNNGATAQTSFPWTPATSGQYKLTLTADDPAESNPLDNVNEPYVIVQDSITARDLDILDVTLPTAFRVGVSNDIAVKVKNLGSTVDTRVSLTFEAKLRTVALEGSAQSREFALLANEERTFTFTWTPGAEDIYGLDFTLTGTNDPITANNVRREVITVGPVNAGSVNLEITSVDVPDALTVGTTYNLDVVIQNNGATPTGSAQLSGTATKNGVERVLLPLTEPLFFGGNDRRTEAVQWTPVEPGLYALTFTVTDPTDTDPSNNQYTIARQVRVVSTGNLSIPRLDVTPRVAIDAVGRTQQPISITGFVKANLVGTSDWVAISVDNVFVDFVGADRDNSGFFRSEIQEGFVFTQTGMYTVSATVHRNTGEVMTASETFEVVRGTGYGNTIPDTQPSSTTQSSTSSVRVTADPKTLEANAGDDEEYLITIKNTGSQTDFFQVELDAEYAIENWFSLTTVNMALAANEKRTISLNVDVPSDALADTYEVKIRAQGNKGSVDIERAALVVTARPNVYDVEVSTPEVLPEAITINQEGDVEVITEVWFKNLKDQSPEIVTLNLYVDDKRVDTKTAFLAHGETKKVHFFIDPTEAPINQETGEYAIYVEGVIDLELDRSPAAELNVRQPAGVSLSARTYTAAPSAGDGTFRLTVEITNNEAETQTYTFSMEGADVNLTPEEVTILGGETRIVTITGTIVNAAAGKHQAMLVINSDQGSTRATVNLDIPRDYGTGGSVGTGNTTDTNTTSTSGISGFVPLLTTPSGLAAIVGLILIILVVGFLYLQKGGSDVLATLRAKLGRPGESNTATDTGNQPPAAQTSGSGLLTTLRTKLGEPVKTEAASNAPTGEAPEILTATYAPTAESLPVTENALNLSNIPKPSAADAVVDSMEAASPWNAQDAEEILTNLDAVKETFKQQLSEAKALRAKLKEAPSRISFPDTQISAQPVSNAPKTGDNYIDSVIQGL